MKIKSMLIASAASLFTVNGALAADAIVAVDPEPANYVQICDAFAGYYMIPGSEVCLDIGGQVRVQFQYSTATRQLTVDNDVEININSRHVSSLGTIGTNITLQNANINSAANGVVGAGTAASPFAFGRVANRNLTVKHANITIAPTDKFTVTLGRAGSFYDGETMVVAAAFDNGTVNAGLSVENNQVIYLPRGSADLQIAGKAGAKFGAVSVAAAGVYRFAGVNFARGWGASVSAKYTADRWSLGLGYEIERGGVVGTLVGFGTSEISVDATFKATDKIDLALGADYYLGAAGRNFAVESSITYKASSNFSIIAEADYIRRGATRGAVLGLDFVAKF